MKITDIRNSGRSMAVKVAKRDVSARYYLRRDGTPTQDVQIEPYSFPSDVFGIIATYDRHDYVIASIIDFCNSSRAPRNYYIPLDLEFTEITADDPLYQKWVTYQTQHLEIMLPHDFSIGSDPEIFVEDKDGTHIPAFLFLGSKEAPDRTPSWGGYDNNGGCTMYWDGFQAEFTTKAGGCLEYHTDSVAAGLRGVYDAARQKFPNARLSLKSVVDIPHSMLEEAEDQYVAFGCMPSFNAYGIRVNMPPAREVPFRSAGGHIHFGIGKLTQEQATPIVKALDAILGVACVSLFANYDSRKRRHLYGLPGEYRLPPHGLEYRPLSNAWLCHPFIMNLVIDVARKVLVLGQKGLLNLWQGNEEETIDIMIRSDVEGARESLKRNKEIFIKILESCYVIYNRWATPQDLEMFYGIFLNGLETAIADPSNFVKNWYLNGTSRDNYDDNGRAWRKQASGLHANVKRSMDTLRDGKKL